MVLTTVLSMLRYVAEIDDRDFVDRLHSYFTANILMALSILVSFKQFGGKPIECMMPDIFSSSWEQISVTFVDNRYLRIGLTLAVYSTTTKTLVLSEEYSYFGTFLLTLCTNKIAEAIRYAASRQEILSNSDDFIDLLHNYYTLNILIFTALIISFKQFWTHPLECLIPDTFTGNWETYAENYCWAQDTYYVPMAHVVDGMPVTERRMRKISYYQWVPFFLLIEAACFRLPCLLWKYMAGYSGIKIHEIVKLSSDPNNIKPDIKKANIKALTVHMQGALRFHRRLQQKQIKPHKVMRFFNLPYSAFFVTSMYLMTKFLYLINVCIQLLIMNKFLETNKYSWYGFGVIRDIVSGNTWEETGVFPRVSLCDFEVRVMGNVQSHTIQCVLVINIFNEKIFVFLWFWYISLVVLTAGSFLYWLMVAILPQPNRRFINRHLEMSEMPFDPVASGKDVDNFLRSYLKSDGVFVIRMITLHSGVIFGTDLVLSLWRSFYGIEEQLKRSNSFPALAVSHWPPPVDTIAQKNIDDDNVANSLRLRRKNKSIEIEEANELLTRLLPSAPLPPPTSKPIEKSINEPDSRKLDYIIDELARSKANIQSPKSFESRAIVKSGGSHSMPTTPNKKGGHNVVSL